MSNEKTTQQVLTLQVTDGLTVAVLQDSSQPTKDVAFGYGVAHNTVNSAKIYHKEELLEGTHFLTVRNSDSGNGNLKKTYWTKAGVIRLGFYIKSERAKLFRDWAEKVILQVVAPPIAALPEPQKRKHNRLDSARLLRVMSLVAQVRPESVRLALVRELMPDCLAQGVSLPAKKEVYHG